LGFESMLPPEAVTLAEVLKAAGYRTAAWSDNPFISKEFGFGQGFERFTGRAPNPLMRGTLLLRAVGQVRLRIAGGAAYSFGPGIDLGADRLMTESVDWLLESEEPSFAYVHLIEPHFPYTPPPPFDGGRRRVDPPHSSGLLPFDSFPALPEADLEIMKANYRGEVEAADAAIGAAVQRLRGAGRLDGTVLLVTSDHGEEFYEHGGWTHGQSLYEELVRVPVLLRFPGQKGEGTKGLRGDLEKYTLSQSYLPGGILDFLGLRVPQFGVPGREPFPSFAEIEAGPVSARAVFHHGGGLIVSRKMDDENVDVFGEGMDTKVQEQMRRLLEKGFAEMEKRALQRRTGRMDDDTRRALEAIGYTGGK
ncbi:MAG: sulfatase-like hydrolase/transferase, partial [Planctomycetota bacterium]